MADTTDWDVLVVGAGLAGQMAAVEAARRGQWVAVLSKTEPFRTHSRHPRGVNLSLKPGDDWRQQADDIWNDSHFLADWDAVDAVCHDGPELVLREFADLLDRDPAGNVVAHDYAGTSRGIMSGNHTGLNFMRRLYGELGQRGVPVLTARTITSLVLDDERSAPGMQPPSGASTEGRQNARCVGLTAINVQTGEIEGYAARQVILCTGGYGYVYHNTAHGPENAGDGAALAYHAGAALKNVEFLYFHHSNVYGTPLIITEGAWNHGVPMVNRHDEQFLEKYSPAAIPERYYMKRYMAENARLDEIAHRSSGTPYHLIRGELRRMMSEDVGVLRDAVKLERARATIQRLQAAYTDACILYHGLQFNEELVEFLGLGSMLNVAEAIVKAATGRTESRGTHWRRDFPNRDDDHWMTHSILTHTPDGPKLTHVPVQTGEFRPRETVVIR